MNKPFSTLLLALLFTSATACEDTTTTPPPPPPPLPTTALTCTITATQKEIDGTPTVLGTFPGSPVDIDDDLVSFDLVACALEFPGAYVRTAAVVVGIDAVTAYDGTGCGGTYFDASTIQSSYVSYTDDTREFIVEVVFDDNSAVEFEGTCRTR